MRLLCIGEESSGCAKAILFLTDGEMSTTAGTKEDLYAMIEEPVLLFVVVVVVAVLK